MLEQHLRVASYEVMQQIGIVQQKLTEQIRVLLHHRPQEGFIPERIGERCRVQYEAGFQGSSAH
jgi:hypothetical protein